MKLWRTWRERWLIQRHPPVPGLQRLGWRRLYILPSRSGFGFAFVLLLMLIGAINYQLSLAFFLTFLLAGVMHAAMLRTYATLLGVQVRAHAGEPVFAGENAQFKIELIPARPGNGIRVSVDGLPGSTDSGYIILPALRRGILPLPRVAIESRQPTGWFRCWTYLHFDTRTVVYPAPELAAPPLPTGASGGSGLALQTHGDEDFAGLRAYQPGDARRLIAWKQIAHSEALLSRQFQDLATAEIVLDWQALAGMTTEARLSRLCAWILEAEAAGQRYALILPGRALAADLGPQHCHACLMALALHPQEVT